MAGPAVENFFKDVSPLNMVLFQPPSPPSYLPDEFPHEMYWVPRSSDPSSCIPMLLVGYPKATRLVIYTHGNADDVGQIHDLMVEFSQAWQAHVVAFDYSGYGWSGRMPTETNINDDTRDVYQYVTGTMKWPSERVILFGHSIGTGPTCALAAKLEREGVDVGGMVLLSPYSSVNAIVKNFVKEGAKSSLLGNITASMFLDIWISKKEMRDIMTTPVMLIHGEQDQLIPCSESRVLYDACPTEGLKILHICPEADHDDFDYDADVIGPVQDFMDKAVSVANVDEWVVSSGGVWVPGKTNAPPDLTIADVDRTVPAMVGALAKKRAESSSSDGKSEGGKNVIVNWFEGLSKLSSMAGKASKAQAKKDLTKGKALFGRGDG